MGFVGSPVAEKNPSGQFGEKRHPPAFGLSSRKKIAHLAYMNPQTPAIRLLPGGWEDYFPLQHKAQPHYFPAGRFQPGLLLYPEFPRMSVAGNPSFREELFSAAQ